MTRTAALLMALALFITACGGDEDTGSTTVTTGGDSTTATTDAGATTTLAETTTIPDDASPADAFIAASTDNIGEYRGQWNNSTFGTSGDLYVNVVEANTVAGFVLIQVDVDGSAFGAEDPELFAVELFVNGDDLEVGTSSFLGETTFAIDAVGNFTLTATPPLLGGEMTLEVSGFMADGSDGFAGTYEIPGLAEGTWGVLPG